MIRTQIQLTESQAKELKAFAKGNAISMAEAIRRSIDRTLKTASMSEEERIRRALAAVGMFSGGPRSRREPRLLLN